MLRATTDSTMQQFVVERQMLLKLKIELLRRGVSQRELARIMGTTPSRISRIIRGRLRLSSRDRRRIAEVLGSPASELFPRRRRRRRSRKEVRPRSS